MRTTSSNRRAHSFSIFGRLFALALALAFMAGTSRAQTGTDGTTPSGLAPGSPSGSYALSGFEDVNLFNGNLNFHLPLLGVGGRGSARHTMTLAVNQKWTVEQSVNDMTGAYHNVPLEFWWNGINPGYGPGVLQGRHGGDGSLRCGVSPGFYYVVTKTLTRLTFTASDGTEYELRDQQTGGQPQPKTCANNTTQYNRGRVFVSADGTSATFISDTDITDRARMAGGEDIVSRHSGYLLLRDGTRYRMDNGTVSWARDRNGNLISYSYDANKRVTAVTDSLGRQATVAYDQAEGAPYGTCDRITFSGFGGAQRVMRICKTNLGSALRTTRPYDATAPQTYKLLFPELGGTPYTLYDPVVVGSVWLPDGQRRYQLFYNKYAELARVVLPTGGAIEYDHMGGYVGGNDDGVVGTGTSRKAHIHRRVVERRVYPDGANLESRITYSRPESISPTAYLGSVGYVTVEQFDAAGTRQTFGRHYYTGTVHSSFSGSPIHYSSWLDGREYKTEEYDAAGTTPLSRTELTWRQRTPVPWWNSTYGPEPANDPRLVTTTTTVEPNGANLVSKTTSLDPADPTGQTVAYDQYNNQTDLWAYDYGAGAPGALLRRTRTEYLYTYASPAPTFDSPHLRALAWKQYVYDAAGVARSYTAFEYDNYAPDANHAAPLDRANITYLCTSYTAVGVCSNPSPSFYTTRGNVTATTRFLLSDTGVVTGSVSEYTQYDVAGNVVRSIDARGKVSDVSYGDSFCNGATCGGAYTPNGYAFATNSTTPVPDPTGQYGSSAAFVTSTVYDFWTGLVYSTTDPNSLVTRAEYNPNDALDRPKAIVRPDGSRVDFEYSDAVGNLYVRTLSDIDATRRTESKQFFDGMSRVYRKAQYENADTSKPWVIVDIAYNSLGGVARKSLPYRAAEGASPFSTDKWMETTYDALGRVVMTTTRPDNAVVTNSYSGNRLTVTDQAGKDRENTTDALGRVTRVVEDPGAGGLNFLTTYTYDVAGQLRKTEQGGQSRFFMYDSLSRLVRARNPEHAVNANLTGTDPFTGNSQWSSSFAYDAAGNLISQTDARGVTSTYTYDNLNRNTYVSYSDATPHVKRAFDTATNGRGRLRGHWTVSAAGVHYTHTAVDSYDALGRPLTQRQHFYTNGVAGPAFNVQRTYDKAGDLLTQTYPSGHTVSYQYDQVGRLADYAGQPAFNGTLGDGVQRTYASQVRYHELGGMEQERFGTATPVYNKHFFNSRGQLNEVRVSTYSITTPGQETNWNRGAILNVYSGNPSDGWTASGADNNGNLRKQMLYVPNDDAITGWWDTAFFYDYDALNRLFQSREARGGQNFWVQYFDYDRWGNRTINAANTNNAPEPQFTASAATNRLSPPAGYAMDYDPAGNLTNDTYTGGGARTYDAENRMTSAQFIAGQLQTAAYTYDGDGRRVKRNMGAGGEAWQVYGMGGELLAEYAAGAQPASPLKEYGYRAGELLVTAAAPQSGGTGLTAQYFDNIDFTGPGLTRVDPALNFDWSGGTPHQSIGVDEFSVRWTGAVQPAYSETYTFYTVSDDGIRLWVNGQLVIDKWIDQGPTEWSGQIALQAGQRYDIRVEFYERFGGAMAKLLWSSPSQAKQVVPQGQLFPAGGDIQWLVADHLGTPRMVIDLTGSLSGVKRHDYFPFGEDVPGDLVGRTPQRGYVGDQIRQQFTGYERDDETGLDYARARYYGAALGRFTGPDNFLNDTYAYDPASWNLYAYVKNNPLRYVDPTGEIVTGDMLTDEQRKALIEDWRRKTGFKKIYFDEKDGYKLKVDKSAGFDAKVEGRNTSGTARTELLAAAESTTRTISIVAVDSTEVRFGSHPNKFTTTTQKDGTVVESHTVNIDFNDFKNLQGDADVLESFSVGLAALHEFEHALHNKDATGKDSPANGNAGPVESTYINPIRREMGLPERNSYGGHRIIAGAVNDYDRGIFFTSADGNTKALRWQHKVVGGKEK
jgi:RHS repeat-associated protein